MQLLVARASMTGFVIFDYQRRYPEALGQLGKWLASGELKWEEKRPTSGFGHTTPLLTLPWGVRARLDAGDEVTLRLLEAAVT